MSLVETGVATVHLLFAAVWTGSVVFVALAVHPLAMDGEIGPEPLSRLAGWLRHITRASAILLLLTGGHLAATHYSVDSLTGTTGGWLVLAMLLLWVILVALVEIATGRLVDGTGRQKIREPARKARRPLQVAAVVAVLLLVDGGLLAAGL